ncbi:MAG: glycosyltransferase family 4 protein [Pyrinomonadaceae bacterium]
MKVLILSEASGRSRYWEAALPLLKVKGIDASFASVRSSGEIHSVLSDNGLDVFAFDSKSARDYPRVAYRLREYLKRENVDIVQASESIQAAIAGTACLFASGTKCLYHYHHTHVGRRQSTFSWIGSRLSDRIMAVSKAAKTAAVEFDGVREQKVSVAYNGIEPLRAVDRSEAEALRSKLEIPVGARVVVIVGRLRPEKGHRKLFEACEIVGASMAEPLHLLVVGDGSERHSLESDSAGYQNFRTHFVGDQQDVALWYAAGDTVTIPSFVESFGLAAVEAMACGKTVVASNVGGLAEIVENEVSGLLVPPDDAPALAGAIRRVLEEPKFAAGLAENAKRRVMENFTMEAMVDGWIRCYEQTLGPTQ